MSSEYTEAANQSVQKEETSDDIINVIYNGLKKVTVVGCVYVFGYMGWSVGWFVAPVIFLIVRDQWKLSAERKRKLAKTVALSSEKEVVLAHLDELPAWVYFPDIERVEWLNRILHQFWPNVNNYTRELIRDTIQPIIKSKLESFKLKGFKFERIILGSIPVRIGGVKVYDKNTDRNEIIMDLEIVYAGDCDITFYLTGIKGGIKDFQLRGMLRVVMKPLIPTIPLVGGLQVFFLNKPDLDFNLIGVADLLDMPGLGELLRKIIVDIISSLMVLPNKFPIKLSEEIGTLELKAKEPVGVLRVHLVEAKHLMKKDFKVIGKGKSDPYAVLTVGAQEHKSPVISNTLDPKWNFWCEFYIEEYMGQELYIHLWDKDDAMTDENLGRATVDISNIVGCKQVDRWLTLDQAKHGNVHIKFFWFSLTKEISDLDTVLRESQALGDAKPSTALVTVFVDSAKNLPQARQQSQPDPYVILKMNNVEKKSEVKMRTAEPVWEESYIFLVENPVTDSIELKVMDHKTSTCLGHLNFNVKNLINRPNMEIYKEPFRLLKSGGDSKILWSINLKILKSDGSKEDIEMESEMEKSDSFQFDDAQPLETVSLLQKQNSRSSIKSTKSLKSQPSFSKQASVTETNELGFIDDSSVFLDSDVPITDTAGDKLVHRTVGSTSSAGDVGLGRLQMTLRYSVQKQKLIVVIHKIANIPVKDPSSVPDPYVKLHLLPERAKESKRKTQVLKDNCNPVFDESFEYSISESELSSKQLEVTVGTQKQLFYSSSNVLGQVIIDLSKLDLNQAFSSWFDLQPEANN